MLVIAQHWKRNPEGILPLRDGSVSYLFGSTAGFFLLFRSMAWSLQRLFTVAGIDFLCKLLSDTY